METTFVFLDVAGSTRRWEAEPDAMAQALVVLDELVAGLVAARRGQLVRPRGEGDGYFLVFDDPADAVACALAVQRSARATAWPVSDPLRVRAGVHVGTAEPRSGDWYGPDVNRCARLRGLAHPGQVLLSGAVVQRLAGAAPAGGRLLDLGRHRLRDIPDTVHVWELADVTHLHTFPPLATAQLPATNLPLELSSFFGRHDERNQLQQMLRRQRLVTLTGAGGIGKTRLALRAAWTALGDHPDGVWLVSLADVDEADLLPMAVASAIGLTLPAGRAAAEVLQEGLVDRAPLLVLDNCEHLRTACADLVTRLLGGARDLRVLVTSRQPLGAPGEQVVVVPPLPVHRGDSDQLGLPPHRMLAHRAEEPPAVALFRDRARAASAPRWVPATDAVVTDICAALDGMPLAIELAAARCAHLSPVEVRQRLDDHTGLLRRTSPQADRHDSLDAALAWSHDLLTPGEQVLLHRLSVFRGPWTARMAESVCADVARDAPDGGGGPLEGGGGLPASAVLEALASLVGHSLVLADTAATPTTYRLLQPIRSFAARRLDAAGERSQVLAGLLRWALRHCATDHPDPTDALEAQVDNLRAALDHAVAVSDRDTGLRLVTDMGPLWLDRYPREGVERLRRLGVAAELVADGGPVSPDEPSALTVLGHLLRDTDLAAAMAVHRRAVELAHHQGDPVVHLRATLGLTLDHVSAGDAQQALAVMDGVVEDARTLGADDLLAEALRVQGWTLLEADRPEDGLPWLEEAQRLASPVQLGRVARALGSALLVLGRLEEAEVVFADALLVQRRSGSLRQLGGLLVNHARVLQSLGRAEGAREALLEALEVAEQLRDPTLAAWSHACLGELLRGDDDLDAAARHYATAVEHFDRVGNRVTPLYLRGNLGRIALRQGRLDDARDAAAAVLQAAQTHHPRVLVEAMELLGAAEAIDGDVRRAVRLLAACAGHRDREHTPREPVDQPDIDQAVAACRRQLGDEFSAAWDAGTATTLQELVPGLLPNRQPAQA